MAKDEIGEANRYSSIFGSVGVHKDFLFFSLSCDYDLIVLDVRVRLKDERSTTFIVDRFQSL
jgi:hypothetical protein